MQRRLRSVSASAHTPCHVLAGQQSFLLKNLFAKFIQKYSDDNPVFNMYLCQFYDTGGILQKSATLANDINRLVCRHPLHLDQH